MKLAPIILFAYNRPRHTKQVLDALSLNDFAKESVLYIYCDGAKDYATKEDITNCEKVQSIAKEEIRFLKVIVKTNKKNYGLANSVIKGVTEIVNKYGNAIILEDDLIVAKGFLKYMNQSLELYKDQKEVMQISGFNFPFNNENNSNSSYFLKISTTWGWATWKRAWEKFNFSKDDYHDLINDKVKSVKFDIEGTYPYTAMLKNQIENKIDSWGIRWWFSIFTNNGLVLYPDKTLVLNEGFGEDATHTKSENPFIDLYFSFDYTITHFPTKIEEHTFNQELLQKYLKPKPQKKTELKNNNYFQKISRKIKLILKY